MSGTNNNKSAFPHDDGLNNTGMTLRDYFAAKALQGWISNPTANDGLPSTATPQDLANVAAAWSYLAADAMMKARAL